MLVGFVRAGDMREWIEKAEAGWTDYPPELLRAMVPDEVVLPGVRATTLVGCLRRAALASVEDHCETPEDLYARTLGKIVHLGLARYVGEGAIVGQRFWKCVGPYLISGEPDVIDPRGRVIRDFKFTHRLPGMVLPHHQAQLNIYRYLVNDMYPIERLELYYLAPRGARRFPAEVWDLERTERYILERARIYLEAAPALPPPPDEDEMWMCRYCPVRGKCFALLEKGL